jgi:Transposase
MKRVSPEECAACIGRDWADAQHASCLPASGSAHRAFLRLDHRPEAIDTWGQSLRTRCNGQPLAVCLALQKGPIVSARRQDEFLVLLPVHPRTVAKSREAFPPRRANDAPPDAALQVELLLNHRAKLPPLSPQSPPMRAWAHLVEPRRRLVGDTVRLTNRLTRALKNDFPHVLQWFQEKDTAIFWDFWSRWPPRKAAQLARRATLASVCRAHHVRSADVRTARSAAIKRARALTTDDGGLPPPWAPGAGPHRPTAGHRAGHGRR